MFFEVCFSICLLTRLFRVPRRLFRYFLTFKSLFKQALDSFGLVCRKDVGIIVAEAVANQKIILSVYYVLVSLAKILAEIQGAILAHQHDIIRSLLANQCARVLNDAADKTHLLIESETFLQILHKVTIVFSIARMLVLIYKKLLRRSLSVGSVDADPRFDGLELYWLSTRHYWRWSFCSFFSPPRLFASLVIFAVNR